MEDETAIKYHIYEIAKLKKYIRFHEDRLKELNKEIE